MSGSSSAEEKANEQVEIAAFEIDTNSAEPPTTITPTTTTEPSSMLDVNVEEGNNNERPLTDEQIKKKKMFLAANILFWIFVVCVLVGTPILILGYIRIYTISQQYYLCPSTRSGSPYGLVATPEFPCPANLSFDNPPLLTTQIEAKYFRHWQTYTFELMRSLELAALGGEVLTLDIKNATTIKQLDGPWDIVPVDRKPFFFFGGKNWTQFKRRKKKHPKQFYYPKWATRIRSVECPDFCKREFPDVMRSFQADTKIKVPKGNSLTYAFSYRTVGTIEELSTSSPVIFSTFSVLSNTFYLIGYFGLIFGIAIGQTSSSIRKTAKGK